MRSGWPVSSTTRSACSGSRIRCVEQDLDGYRQLRAAVTTRICTGEKGWTGDHFGRLIDSGALDVIMIDPGKAEGVTGTWNVIRAAAAAGRDWNAHSWSSALNTAASLHLATASDNVLVMELKPLPSPMQHELRHEPDRPARRLGHRSQRAGSWRRRRRGRRPPVPVRLGTGRHGGDDGAGAAATTPRRRGGRGGGGTSRSATAAPGPAAKRMSGMRPTSPRVAVTISARASW